MPASELHIEYCATDALSAPGLREILTLCEAAYEEDLAGELRNIGAGVHALGRVSGVLVTHAMIVPRILQPGDGAHLHTAYVELVATESAHQRRGYATALLHALESQMQDFQLGALSPSDAEFYSRIGWELWRGPLSVRTAAGREASPADEEVMIRRVPRTPSILDLDAPLSCEWRAGDVW